jgi:hypothetical protein
LRVYDEAWGSLDVIPLRDLKPQVEKIRGVVDLWQFKPYYRDLDEALAPLEALIRQAGL